MANFCHDREEIQSRNYHSFIVRRKQTQRRTREVFITFWTNYTGQVESNSTVSAVAWPSPEHVETNLRLLHIDCPLLLLLLLLQPACMSFETNLFETQFNRFSCIACKHWFVHVGRQAAGDSPCRRTLKRNRGQRDDRRNILINWTYRCAPLLFPA